MNLTICIDPFDLRVLGDQPGKAAIGLENDADTMFKAAFVVDDSVTVEGVTTRRLGLLERGSAHRKTMIWLVPGGARLGSHRSAGCKVAGRSRHRQLIEAGSRSVREGKFTQSSAFQVKMLGDLMSMTHVRAPQFGKAPPLAE
ncbi:hypothetical protein D3C80_1671350 [compost metagenome]